MIIGLWSLPLPLLCVLAMRRVAVLFQGLSTMRCWLTTSPKQWCQLIMDWSLQHMSQMKPFLFKSWLSQAFVVTMGSLFHIKGFLWELGHHWMARCFLEFQGLGESLGSAGQAISMLGIRWLKAATRDMLDMGPWPATYLPCSFSYNEHGDGNSFSVSFF